MSLLQQTLEKRLNLNTAPVGDESDSDYDVIDVVSLPGTPARSRAPTRPTSPLGDETDPSKKRRAMNSLTSPVKRTSTNKRKSLDPLKALPTEISQKIFARLRVSDLAKCARVCQKWSRSQTINYVWFQHYRKENFRDESLPPGKWTKRESKQNWRVIYLQSAPTRDTPNSGYGTPTMSRSGYQTPREIKEEKWRQEAESSPGKSGKLEMREMYKELGGRKARSKNKVGAGKTKDKGGWGDTGDSIYDAPW